MAHGGLNKWTPPRKSEGIPGVSTRFSLSMGNEQAGAGRDGRTRLARPDSQARRGQRNVNFPCLADHEQDRQPYPVDQYSSICDDHTLQLPSSNPIEPHDEFLSMQSMFPPKRFDIFFSDWGNAQKV